MRIEGAGRTACSAARAALVSHGRKPMTSRTAAAIAALLSCATLPARAQTPGSLPEPYYLGVSQAVSRDSNLFRLPDGSPTPTSAKSRSDLISTTSLLAGLDRSFGRQRLRGSATLQHNRFRDNEQFDNDGHGLNLVLDWETLNRLSGNVSLASNRSLRRFDPSETNVASERNVETVKLADATVRLGVVTRATVEANVNHREVGYSSARYADREYKQTSESIGARYRPAAAATVGAGLRFTQGRYARFDDRYDRRDIDFTGRWEPGDGTVVSGRLSYGKTEYDRATQRNYSGPSAVLGVLWQPTGKIRLTGRAARDTGQDFAFLNSGIGDRDPLTADYSRTTTSAKLQAVYLATAKTQLQLSASHARRSLATRLPGSSVQEGSDRVTQWQIGPTWMPSRGLQFGCDLTHERRSARGVGSSPYRSNGASCYGQFTMFPG
jgi:hypothetical protein